jgi:uncharacterized protein YcsI (UPF0317 family)
MRKEDYGIGQLQIGDNGTVMKELRRYSVTFDAASVAANTVAEQNITAAGVKSGDIVLSALKSTHTAGLSIVAAKVAADNTITARFANCTGTPIDAGSDTYVFVVARF